MGLDIHEPQDFEQAQAIDCAGGAADADNQAPALGQGDELLPGAFPDTSAMTASAAAGPQRAQACPGKEPLGEPAGGDAVAGSRQTGNSRRMRDCSQP